METVVKLLFKQLVSYSALRAFPHFPHHPLVVQKNKKHSGLIYPCACGICVPFRLHSVLGFLFVPHRETRHFITPSFQAYTSAPHSLVEILISIPQASFNHFPPKPFPTHFQRYVFIFCGEFTTIKRLKAERKVITPYRCVVKASPTRKQCPENHL